MRSIILSAEFCQSTSVTVSLSLYRDRLEFVRQDKLLQRIDDLDMKTRLFMILFPVLAILTLPSAGQSYVGAAGLVNAGYMYTPALTSSINSVVGDSIQFLKGHSIVGGEINYRDGHSIVALSGYIGFQEGKFLDRKVFEPFLWKAHAGYGWIPFKRRHLFIYPVTGVGATGSSIASYDFSRGTSQRITVTAPSIDLSIHTDYLLDEILISIRAGYNRSLWVSKWHNTFGEERGTLTPHQMQGWYLTISFGGLAFIKNKPTGKI